MKEFYWRKYDITEDWTEEETDDTMESRTIKTKNIEEEQSPPEDYLYFSDLYTSISGVRFEYEIQEQAVYGSYSDNILKIKDSYPEIINRTERPIEFNFETGDSYWPSPYGGRYFDEPTPVYAFDNGVLTEYRTTFFDVKDYRPGSTFADWRFTQAEFDAVKKLSLEELTIHRNVVKGALVDEIIAEEGDYPIDGIQGGFWWVRGDEYTIEPPELISPEALFKANEKVNYFEFKLKERQTTCPGNYHARLKVGTRSDFQETLFIADTTQDRSNFEYFNGSSWQPFPSGGVDGETRVRYYVPETVDWQFGVYFWSAQGWHSFWGYGPLANFRSIILLTETDEVYQLFVGGIEYKANNLTVLESSNGEIGKINIRLLNRL